VLRRRAPRRRAPEPRQARFGIRSFAHPAASPGFAHSRRPGLRAPEMDHAVQRNVPLGRSPDRSGDAFAIYRRLGCASRFRSADEETCVTAELEALGEARAQTTGIRQDQPSTPAGAVRSAVPAAAPASAARNRDPARRRSVGGRPPRWCAGPGSHEARRPARHRDRRP